MAPAVGGKPGLDGPGRAVGAEGWSAREGCRREVLGQRTKMFTVISNAGIVGDVDKNLSLGSGG